MEDTLISREVWVRSLQHSPALPLYFASRSVAAHFVSLAFPVASIETFRSTPGVFVEIPVTGLVGACWRIKRIQWDSRSFYRQRLVHNRRDISSRSCCVASRSI